MDSIRQTMRISIILLLLFTILCGAIYPGLITCIGQLLFPKMANGSLIVENGVVVGSELIGQEFTQDHYFWGRPSATAGYAYNGLSSGGSNLSCTNPELKELIVARIDRLRKHADEAHDIPVDLVYASGSGLDPEISLSAAMFQATRVAKNRKLAIDDVVAIINQYANKKFLIFGNNRVNVLKLNLALDQIALAPARKG